MSRSTLVRLTLRQPLYRPEETPQFSYFMVSGMASILAETENGDVAEVGIVGSEGAVGCLHLLGPAKVATNCFVQIEGAALRISFTELRKLYGSSEEIRNRILECVQQQAITTSLVAGCNRFHESEARLARWLLMAENCTQSDVLGLTQEFLAMMLGSRRTTVTLVAGLLQDAGLIEYRRGQVRILDRVGLESVACDCYKVIQGLSTNLYAAT